MSIILVLCIYGIRHTNPCQLTLAVELTLRSSAHSQLRLSRRLKSQQARDHQEKRHIQMFSQPFPLPILFLNSFGIKTSLLECSFQLFKFCLLVSTKKSKPLFVYTKVQGEADTGYLPSSPNSSLESG